MDGKQLRGISGEKAIQVFVKAGGKKRLLGGMNSRPYRRQQLMNHRAGHLALPAQLDNSPIDYDFVPR